MWSTVSRVWYAGRVFAMASLGACVLAAPVALAEFRLGIQDVGLINPDPDVQRATFDDARAVGGQIVRVMVSWHMVAAGCGSADPSTLANPEAPCYDWAVVDRAVARARERDIEVVASIWHTPTWLFGSDDVYGVGVTDADVNRFANRYADFARAAAARYASGSSRGAITRWTVLNEPNSSTFWHPSTDDSVERYALVYARAVRAIHAASPGARVAVGPTGPKSLPRRPIDFLRAFRRALRGIDPTVGVDAWGHNPYPGQTVSPFEPVFSAPSVGIGNIGDLLHALDEDALTRGVPVWITEFAYQSDPPDARFGATLEQQSVWLAQAIDIASTTGRVPIFVWYVLRDPADVSDWNSGLRMSDGTAKPAYAMFQRPVSIAPLANARNGLVRVWGRSNLDPSEGLLVASRDREHWMPVRSERNADGAVTAWLSPDPGRWVAVRDGSGVGPALSFAASARLTPAQSTVVSAIRLRQRFRGARAWSTCGVTVATRCRYGRRVAVVVGGSIVPATAFARRPVSIRVLPAWGSHRRRVAFSAIVMTTASGRFSVTVPWRRTRAGTWRVVARAPGAIGVRHTVTFFGRRPALRAPASLGRSVRSRLGGR